MSLHPWLKPQLEQLISLYQSNRLPHGLLLEGPRSAGKLDLAQALAAALVCDQPGPAGHCGTCAECDLFAAGTHPDFMMVAPEDSKQLKVDQLRDMIAWANQTPARGGNQVVVISPADAMNIASSNALLKCLEEPTAGTYLVLVTAEPSRLLPTIRSRCQTIPVRYPDLGQARDWLSSSGTTGDLMLLLGLAGGSPLLASELAESGYLDRRLDVFRQVTAVVRERESALVAASALYEKDSTLMIYEILYSVLADVLKRKAGAPVTNTDQVPAIDEMSVVLDGTTIAALSDRVLEARNLMIGVNNPNEQLLLESVLGAFVPGSEPRVRDRLRGG